jgi:hypothetical protein
MVRWEDGKIRGMARDGDRYGYGYIGNEDSMVNR